MSNSIEKNSVLISDKEKFEHLFLSYFPKVKAYINKFIGIEYDAEDIAQDIFVKLWMQRDLLDDINFIDAYLYKMARNAVYNFIKHKSINFAYAEKLKKENTDKDDGYNSIYANEIKEYINKVVTNMPPQRKKIFLMSRKQGLSNAEIASRLNLSKKTVDNHLALALRELKKIIHFFIFFIF